MSTYLKNPEYYFNRELSWVKFNERVLAEAQDKSHPLLERLKFLSIVSSNFDEFFMIRVAGLKDQVHAGIYDIPIDGMTPDEQIREISKEVHRMVAIQSQVLEEEILPELSKKGIRLRKTASLRKSHKEYLKKYFKEKIFPVLTPLAIDPSHPFPQLRNLGLNILVEVRTAYKTDNKLAVVHIPPTIERFIHLPTENGHCDFVRVESAITQNLDLLFPGLKIVDFAPFRVTRNADLDLSEAEADDLLKLIERELRKRRLGTVIRLELYSGMSKKNRNFLMELNGLAEEDVYDIPTVLDLSNFMKLIGGLDFPGLKDRPFVPALHDRSIRDRNIFKTISEGDIILHHPYDSFNHVVDFIKEAANDPKVLAIKQTLYRTSGKSAIVQALKEAVVNGKQVTALIELKARFDEQNNIEWAKELDRAGVNVVYGVLGLKTHCKICMIVRREGKKTRTYLHLGTGNYNATTARLYTDLSLMTCNSDMGDDASELFNLLTGYSLKSKWKKFLVAPGTLRKDITQFIHDTIKNHKPDKPGRIIIVVNSLVDPEMIMWLYKASMKGIKVDLIVRGICCLRPGIKGISDNIRVTSIVGRFLEHCRIFYFKSEGESRIYLGSADLMQRNLNRRVELVFPLLDAEVKKEVRSIIQCMLDDNLKAWLLKPDGSYVKPKLPRKIEPHSAQMHFLELSGESQKHTDTIGR